MAQSKFEDALSRLETIVGQLEKAAYPGEGLEKFPGYSGKLWDIVYHEGETAIYRVRP